MFNIALISGPLKKVESQQKWMLWLAWMAGLDYTVIGDVSAYAPEDLVSKEDFIATIQKCTVEISIPLDEQLGIDQETTEEILNPEQTEKTDIERIEEWRVERLKVYRNPPGPNDILTTRDDSLVKLNVQLNEGREPFIFGRCFVPTIVGERLTWFAQNMNENFLHGYKIIMLPKAHRGILSRFPELPTRIGVKSLRVIRLSKAGKSLLGEVNEF